MATACDSNALYYGLGVLTPLVLPPLARLLRRLCTKRRQSSLSSYRGGYRELDASLLNLASDGTRWMNLGLWPAGEQGEEGSAGEARGEACAEAGAATPYAEACAALARRLGQVAGLHADDRVLDTGFGRGDQIMLWADEFQVRHIRGINISPAEVADARQRIRRWQRDVKNGGQGEAHLSIELTVGDATRLPLLLGNNAPSCSSSSSSSSSSSCNAGFTKVLSLDCAYHYDTRREFFDEAMRVLQVGASTV